jgi:pimeloyl-ACP methyl ester carboxylesterase
MVSATQDAILKPRAAEMDNGALILEDSRSSKHMAARFEQLYVLTPDGVRLSVNYYPGFHCGVLLIHGLASNGRLWEEVAEELNNRGRAVAVLDLRGHGVSEQCNYGFTIDELAADVCVVLSELARRGDIWARPIVAGQSLGGNIALAVAASGRQDIVSLVFVDGGFYDLPAMFSSWQECVQQMTPPDLTSLTRDQLLERIKVWHPDWSAQAIAGAAACFAENEAGYVYPRLKVEHHMAILRSLWESRPLSYAQRVVIPVVLIAAEGARNAGSTKRACVEALVASLPGCKLIWRNDACHDFHAEQPQETVDIILGVISE